MSIEDIAERYEAMSWRRRLRLAGAILAVFVVMGVGLNTIVASFLKGHPNLLKPPKLAGQAKTTGTGVHSGLDTTGQALSDIHQASFEYLLPRSSGDWTVDDSTKAYAADRGIVKYNLVMSNASVRVTITQQSMPEQLGSRQSPVFITFINGNKPTRSLTTGEGTLYFLPALQNGAAAAGSDTVIFATDQVLMFGRAERVMGWEGWTRLMAAMKTAG